MADDLGDFFAKKDKRKKKKAQITSANLIEQLQSDAGTAGTEEEAVKITVLKAKELERPDDNEWIEIGNDNLAEGLSDLKIKSLDAKEEEVEAFERNDEGVEDSDEEEGDAKGPWAAVSSSPPVHEVKKQLPPVSIPANLTSGGKYVPPSQRVGGAPTPQQNANRRAREKLDVTSMQQFPGLGGMTSEKPRAAKHDPSFENVKGSGSRKQQNAPQQSQTMELNNKFGVLQSWFSLWCFFGC